ncbi:MAG: UDP-N-acetylmuramoyl-L-alanyl-D-glutamate--2,6-diaminopimelate ligase, partial [Actinobacteria bacterium]
ANFYEDPTSDLFLVGVTGTNGKTTTTYMLESIINAAGKKSGLLGTVDNRIGEKSFPVSHTTPESVDLQKIFSTMKKEKVDSAVMEVSSHACLLHRVDNCHFDQVVFTNLTQDHLDFHKDIESYFAAKKSLFDLNEAAVQIINIDDKYGRVLLNNNKKTLTYGFMKEADFRASNVRLSNYGSQFIVNFLGREFNFEIMLGGLFNVYNALAAIASSINMEIEPEIIQNGLYNLKNVPGRFEIIRSNAAFKVVIDYAHTPDGLKNLLESARKITSGKLITVFGCGGERDKTKRPLMGKIASELSDKVIVTSDNPRGEDSQIIIDQITGGAQDSFVSKVDRKEAIKVALAMAEPKDTVIIAGKGHEDTQEINGENIPFDDSKIVKGLLQ